MTRGPRAAICCLLICAGWASNAPAQGFTGVHWAYSAYFGTGWYTVNGDRDVFVFRVNPRWALSESSQDEGKHRAGWYLRTPVVAGLDRFDIEDPVDAIELDNVSYLSLNPGIEAVVPVNKTWALRPYASIGYGAEISGGSSAWSYWAGVRSHWTFHEDERLSWGLVNNVGYVGYTPDKGKSDHFWPIMTGLEVAHSPGRKRQKGGLLLHWSVGYTYFGNDLIFEDPGDDQEITEQWEIGLALGKSEERIKIWFMSFDRLGLGYRQSSDGSLKGIKFIFRSSFEG